MVDWALKIKLSIYLSSWNVFLMMKPTQIASLWNGVTLSLVLKSSIISLGVKLDRKLENILRSIFQQFN